MRKGNQVRILSDPVTVFREYSLVVSIVLRYEKERDMRRSVSQETCLVLEERLPMKVQFLTKRYLRYVFLGCLRGSRHFLFMECARCGTVQAAGMI